VLRVATMTLALSMTTAANSASAAWPLRAVISDLSGRPITFKALTLGGELIVPVGPPNAIMSVRSIGRGDTISATTPAQFPLDLTRGAVVFLASGKDSISVTVGRNPYGSAAVTARGHRLEAHLVRGAIKIDAK
jgi:hypothetical protein